MICQDHKTLQYKQLKKFIRLIVKSFKQHIFKCLIHLVKQF